MRFKDQRISITEIDYAIRWIVIYPVDSAIQRLNNRGQNYTRLFLKGRPGKNWSPPMRHLFEWPGPFSILLLLLLLCDLFTAMFALRFTRCDFKLI